MKIDLTPILQALIGLLATIITVKIVPWIRASTSERQRKLLRALIQTLVCAAEQLYGAGAGEEKLAYVRRELEARGYEFDRAAVEAAVYEAFNWGEDGGDGKPPDEETN